MSIRRLVVAAAVLATALSATTALDKAEATGQGPAAARARAYTVTASVNKAEPMRGKSVTIKGKVRPAAPGTRVVLQKSGGGAWKTIDRGRLSGASTYRFKVEVRHAREYAYRVVKPSGGHRSAGRSRVVTVTVYTWRSLFDLPSEVSEVELQSSLLYVIDSLIGGNHYGPSLESQNTPFSVSTDTNRACKTFRATLGLSDFSPTDGRANFSVSADGVERFSGSYGLGEAEQIVIDVTGVLATTISGTTENGGAGIGRPEFLCTRPHP
jgi:hypothetical protein